MKSFWTRLEKPFFVLAPMEAVTDVVFRHVVARAAPADVYISEFTNAASFCSPKGEASTRGRLTFTPDEQPIVAQIWGTNPEHFGRMARDLKQKGFTGIDINMGCPEKSIVRGGSCAGLIANPTLAAELIAATQEAGLPVSVKTRLGLKTIATQAWCGFLLGQNLAALSVHGRTQKEMTKVPAHWDEIGAVVALRDQLAPQTLIIGNGDVRDRTHGLELAQQYGLDGIMIGRGIFHNPFGFEKIPKPHSERELIDLLYFHLDMFDKHTRDRKFDPLKRFFKVYIRDFAGASQLRQQLMQTTTTTEARIVLDQSI